MKKLSIASFCCALLAPLLIAGCSLYKNPNACEARMRETVARNLPNNELSVSHVGVGIRGSRVVVEGTVEGPTAAAIAATQASAPIVASAPGATSPAVAAKPKKTKRPAAAECLFDGESLTSMRWFNPPELTASAAAAASAP
ncbi:hypothetical protein [Trinickia symbiotica]|uniref:BON domain-containing protein n=1 Tax=Trinickia symbiotica TaxID=863227 RepID=A0A2N7X8X9_9BURK|nr:hypothetical protein [Trinickia symbiotica]PMS38060.1 hypothetical protein C0Z20_04465 [Trinickia symbiotica]